jgi:hypothetical protein
MTEITGDWDSHASWGGTGIFGPKEPEYCDVANAVRQASWTANYPGGHPERNVAADALAADQTTAAYGRSLGRQYAAQFQADPEPPDPSWAGRGFTQPNPESVADPEPEAG